MNVLEKPSAEGVETLLSLTGTVRLEFRNGNLGASISEKISVEDGRGVILLSLLSTGSLVYDVLVWFQGPGLGDEPNALPLIPEGGKTTLLGETSLEITSDMVAVEFQPRRLDGYSEAVSDLIVVEFPDTVVVEFQRRRGPDGESKVVDGEGGVTTLPEEISPDMTSDTVVEFRRPIKLDGESTVVV
jgi:hypothetical protein